MSDNKLEYYTGELSSLIKEMKNAGIECQPYENVINNIVVERGIAIIQNTEASLVTTWTLTQENERNHSDEDMELEQ